MGSQMSTMWLDTWWTWKRSTLTKVTLTRESSREDRRSFSTLLTDRVIRDYFLFSSLSFSLPQVQAIFMLWFSGGRSLVLLRSQDKRLKYPNDKTAFVHATSHRFAFLQTFHMFVPQFFWTIINPISGYVVDHSSPKKTSFLNFLEMTLSAKNNFFTDFI